MGGALPIELWRHIISSFACRTQSRCIRNSRGRMPRYSLHAVPRSCKVWHSRQGSNLQPAVLETAALPLELPEYKSRPWNRTSRVYTHAPRSKLRSGGHIKTAPVRRRGCWLAHILSGKLHLGKDSKAFSWHGRLHVRPCGLSSPCAIRCDTAESNRLLSLMSGRLPLFQCIA